MTTIKKRRNTRHHKQPAVTVYVTPTCANCPKTLKILRDHNISHTIVDLSKDKTAYTYVTQNLGYRSVPAVKVEYLWEINTWTGHHPDLIAEHILQHYRADNQVDDIFEDIDPDRMTQANANTTAAIRASGLGGLSTGPHLEIRSKNDQWPYATDEGPAN